MTQTDDEKILDLVTSAIDNDRIDEARSLLRPLMQRNVVEAYYLASRVAYTQEQALEFLRYALGLDPDNLDVKDALDQLETLYATQSNLAIVDPNRQPVPQVDKDNIEKAVVLFQRYGWETIIQEDNHAQFMRRQTMSSLNAFILGLGLNLIGLVLTIILLLGSDKIHAFVDAEDGEMFLNSSKGNMLLHRPQQSIIFLDKTNGASIMQGIGFALLGVLIGAVALGLIYWQSELALSNFMDAILTPTFAPDM